MFLSKSHLLQLEEAVTSGFLMVYVFPVHVWCVLLWYHVMYGNYWQTQAMTCNTLRTITTYWSYSATLSEINAYAED